MTTQRDGDARRIAYARRHGMDILYAEQAGDRYELHTYSDGDRVYMGRRYTLEGLQDYARRHHYAILYI